MSNKKDKIIIALLITVFILISVFLMTFNQISFIEVINFVKNPSLNRNIDISSQNVPLADNDKAGLRDRQNLLTEYLNSPELKIINSTFPVEKTYSPNLKTLPEKYSNFPEVPRLVDERIYDSIVKMLDSARTSGVKIYVYYTYRSFSEQKDAFDKAVSEKITAGLSEQDAITQVKKTIAYPGTSEHQYGFSADIGDGQEYEFNAIKQTSTNLWLKDNAHNFGFIYRYPENKASITSVESEPWHFRYVGEVHAKYIYENEISLEEYIDVLQKEADDIKVKLSK